MKTTAITLRKTKSTCYKKKIIISINIIVLVLLLILIIIIVRKKVKKKRNMNVRNQAEILAFESINAKKHSDKNFQ